MPSTSDTSYRAQVMRSPGRLELQSRSRRSLAPTEARLAVHAAGVCGTDLALYSGAYPVPLPLVMGHEFYGRVIELGIAATTLDRRLLGQLATAEINNTCLALRRPDPCAFCRHDLSEHCSERTVTGIIRHDGAFADEVVVPLGALHALPATLAEPLGMFIEPLAAALQTFERRPLARGERVLVLGLGRLGLLIAAVARQHGAEVLGVSRGRAKVDRARAWGIDAVAYGSDVALLRDLVRDWTHGLGAGVVVEATGDPDALGLAGELVRPRGTVCLKSTPGPPAAVPLTAMVVREIDISCSRCGPFARAIAFQGHAKLPLASLITDEFDLDDLADALRAAPRAGKVVVRGAAGRA